MRTAEDVWRNGEQLAYCGAADAETVAKKNEKEILINKKIDLVWRM